MRLPTGVRARLRPPRCGNQVERAAELSKGITAGLTEPEPRPLGWDVRLEGFESMRASDATRSNLWLASGGAALMLAVATIDVVHVVLAGALQRDQELSIRAALGARAAGSCDR